MQTVRIWQGSNDGNYNCHHTLKDHKAEVNVYLMYVSLPYLSTNGLTAECHKPIKLRVASYILLLVLVLAVSKIERIYDRYRIWSEN